MKYVIWGAGQRGKKALSLLGKERVLYFVDKNPELQGTKIDGVKVYSPKCLDKAEGRYIILITPVDYSEQIANELDKAGKGNYLLFADHPYCIDMSENVDSLRIIDYIPKLDGKIAIYGITWFTLFLYDYFLKCGKDPIIFCDGNNQETILTIIENEYAIVKNYEDLNSVDYIIAPIRTKNIDYEKFIDIEDYIQKAYPSNPEISQYENLHKGKRCFIVATGPSLNVSDLDRLKKNGDICISMNRIYNLFDKTDWRPDYYVIEDEKMIEDLADEIVKLNLKHKFVCSTPHSYWEIEGSETSISYKMIMQDCLTDRIGFSFNPDRILYNGYTVTYVCLQLAVYMGFSEIYLIGLDFNYSDDIYAESNHFEGYQNHYKDIRLNPVKPDRMKRAYRKARRVAENINIHIYNATRGGKLEVFDRVDLDTLF